MSSSSYNNRLTKKEREIINRQAAMAAQRQSQSQNTSSRPRPPPPSRIRNVKSKAPTSLSELLGGPPRKSRPPPPPKHVPKRAINTSTSNSSSKNSSSSSTNSRNNNTRQSNVRSGIRPRPTSASASTSMNTSNDGIIDLTKDSPEKEKNQNKLVQILQQRRTTHSAALHVNKPKPAPPPPPVAVASKWKRPSKRGTNLKVESVIQASRSRLKEESTGGGNRDKSRRNGSGSAEKRPSKIPGKSSAGSSSHASSSNNASSSGSGRLSSLLKNAGVTQNTLETSQSKGAFSWEDEQDKNGSALDFEIDYFGNLRKWDFLKDWNEERGGGGGNGGGGKKRDKNGNSSSNSSASTGKEKHVTIPDTFTSRKQYQQMWAPLCLSEARAQILSDASSNIPWRNRNHNGNNNGRGGGGGGGGRGKGKTNTGSGPAPITARASAKDISGGSSSGNNDAMMVITSPRKGSYDMGPSFMNGDVVVLGHEESSFVKASKGQLYHSKRNGGTVSINMNKRMGIVGHVEYSRRTTDGLKIMISRNLWAKFCKSGRGEEDIYILNVGGNITSMREFTALCRASQLKLLPYLLGKKMTRSRDNLDTLSDAICLTPEEEESPQKKKEAHLKSMGGKAALGEGFTKYAGQKFNHSQLGAISAAASEYGDGGFTLIKGPPGTGKTTTLVALLNALHIRQFNHYYDTVRKIVDVKNVKSTGATKLALAEAKKQKPRLLVCAPSNNAIDNVIQKIMEGGFVDGAGRRYNPSIVRIGSGQSDSVKNVSLETQVDHLLSEMDDAGKIQSAVAGYKSELSRIQMEIHQHRRKLTAILRACDYPLALEWEIRVVENLQPVFVNHSEKRTTYECPPPPEPGEKHRQASSSPEFKVYNSQLVKLVDRFTNINSKLERYILMSKKTDSLRDHLQTNILDSTHIVLTTLGTSGCRALESCAKFEVVVVDEAAQSVEPATLVALQLGSSHAILVGDPNQLPATIFSVSGRTTKYDRSLFQRLEEAGHEVHLLDTQYRMHPQISQFPRNIFYGGLLKDGPNVLGKLYGNPLRDRMMAKLPSFKPFTVFDLDSSEERGGSSLSNATEARFALQLYQNLTKEFGIFVSTSKVSVITPYAQQAALIRQTFAQALGSEYRQLVEVNTVDSFQGREANIVIFSCVRAAGSKGIGFLSDVRRMNVALTRAKHFLFVIARCKSISVNPYWGQLVKHAKDSRAVVTVPRSFVGSDAKLSVLKVEDPEKLGVKRRKMEKKSSLSSEDEIRV
uniref:WW domain-containing protein n=1 Tax=Chaetoceros debilis TaxID=122233 RepID=A0A7S3QDL7_9STRA